MMEPIEPTNIRLELSKQAFDFAKIIIAGGVLTTVVRQDYGAGTVISVCGGLAILFFVAGILLYKYKNKDKDENKKQEETDNKKE